MQSVNDLVSIDFENEDEKLLNLQKEITLKLSKVKDELLIKHYLKLSGDIARQRIELRKKVAHA